MAKVSKRALRARLRTRARAFASDPALITDAVLDLATDEALELGGAGSSLPVLADIAYYRVLLQIGAAINELEQAGYRTALKQVSDPAAAAASARPAVKARKNAYR